jgi:spore coat protein U-like protein
MKLFKAIALCATLVTLLSIGAFATNATGNLGVSASVSASCAVASGATLAFGAYDPAVVNATNPLTQNSTFDITCTSGTSATVMLGQGLHAGTGSSDASPARQMLNATDGTTKMGYGLYQDTNDQTVWGNTTGTGETDTGNGSAQSLTVYGEIPAGQNVSAGSYADTVVITVSY